MSNTHQRDAGQTPAERKPHGLKPGPRSETLDQPIGDPKSPDDDEELDQPIGDPSPDGDDDNDSDHDQDDEPGREPGDVQNDEHDEEIGKPIPHKV